MILRRVMEHLRKQEWTAVGIDFVIVVLGIFLGLLANDMREQRVLETASRGSLVLLLEDLSQDIDRLEYITERQRLRVVAFARVTTELGRPTPDYAVIDQSFQVGIPENRTFYARGRIYEVMEAQGQLAAVPDALRRSIRATYGYDMPALAAFGLLIDDNQNLLLSSCVEQYWDIEGGVPVERNRADLVRLRNCVWDLREASRTYVDYVSGELRERAVALEAALQAHLGVTPTRQRAEQGGAAP